MTRRFRAGLVLLCSLLPASTALAADKIVQAGWLLAVPGNPPQRERSVVLHDDRITAVLAGYVRPGEQGTPAGAELIDLRDKFVLPGLIDCHVHLTSLPGPRTTHRDVTQSDAAIAMDTFVAARATLAAGFTTVRDLGARGDAIFAVRDAIEAGKVMGPRIIAAGDAISIVGGHGDIGGYREEVMAVLPRPNVCSGADDCRRAVRDQIRRGADVIKITATGGVTSESKSAVRPEFTDAELAAIVEIAHGLGRRVAAHAHAEAGIDAALRAGVDSIEHGTFAGASSFALFKKTGAWLVPTQMTIGVAEEIAQEGSAYPAGVQAKARLILLKMQTALRGIAAAGVKIAFGTDAGTFEHGRNGGEFLYLAKAGLTPMQAIQTATVNAADLLGLRDEIGTIEPGKIADLIAVGADPLQDLAVLQKPEAVIHNGRRATP
jgi:imidazolonepropionase-like amidohydrolase